MSCSASPARICTSTRAVKHRTRAAADRGAWVATPDPRERFSNRADAYRRGRPGYPVELIEILRRDFGLRAEQAIADIGCGTGILAAMFLQNGNQVFGIEPNAAMRAGAESALSREPRFS